MPDKTYDFLKKTAKIISAANDVINNLYEIKKEHPEVAETIESKVKEGANYVLKGNWSKNPHLGKIIEYGIPGIIGYGLSKAHTYYKKNTQNKQNKK